MEEITLLLFIAALLCCALSFKISTRTVSMFTIVLSVCGLSAVFQDATITDNMVYLVAFPLIVVTLFGIGNLCILKGDRA